MKTKVLLLIFCFLISACVQITTQPEDISKPDTSSKQPTMETLPNPASKYCEQQGFYYEIRTADDGSQSGVCIFPDGSECDEWKYYRGECAPTSDGSNLPNPASVFCEQQGFNLEVLTAPDGSQTGYCIFKDGSSCDEWAYFRGECKPGSTNSTLVAPEGWKVYSNEALGYSFYYPAEAQITTNDEPLKSLYIAGIALGTETWTIAHPNDRDDYRPPEGVDLLQWLSDHYLLGENRQPDEVIAGKTAIHFRHEASSQSYAFDQYFFSNAGQLYLITIGHSDDVEDWNLNNIFLKSFTFSSSTTNTELPTIISTIQPGSPNTTDEWTTYTQPEYGFSFKFPDGWIVEEGNPNDILMGHVVYIHNIITNDSVSIRLTFRQSGDDTLLWPTGVGSGEFVPRGTLDIAGQPALRLLLVCGTGEITSIWYQQSQTEPNITRGDMEFGIIVSAENHCEPGYDITSETQRITELIIASLQLP